MRAAEMGHGPEEQIASMDLIKWADLPGLVRSLTE